jgi:hypothetical protein
MDINKIFSDLRKIGFHLIVTHFNISSISLVASTGNQFESTILLGITEANSFDNTYIYDITLQIGEKQIIQEFLIDSIEFNKLYDQSILTIKSHINHKKYESKK